MYSLFIDQIQKNQLFLLSDDRILLAVSGGIDSIAMVHLMHKAGVDFGIAHCNFKLRGEASEGDFKFVQELCESLNVTFHGISFETEKIALKTGKSIQITARDLRYEWLEKIRRSDHYNFIATAHHHDDNVETVFLNMIKGCGIKGLLGIPQINGKIIRPLLFASKKQIVDYVQSNNLSYRIDESNFSDKYQRNLLRNKIIPLMEKINPNLSTQFRHNLSNFKATYKIYRSYVDEFISNSTKNEAGLWYISIDDLMQCNDPLALLFELLNPFGFKTKKIKKILKENNRSSGLIYVSNSHRLLKDRSHWILQPNNENFSEKIYLIQNGVAQKINHQDIELELRPNVKMEMDLPQNKVIMDLELLKFPLKLRNWQPGDSFCPLGMNGKHKKLSKFFKDLKLSIFEKEKVRVLCDQSDNILWVVGYRMDERCKVNQSSKNLISFELLQKNYNQ